MKTRDPRIAALSLGARYLLEAVEELATNGVVTATATMTLAATLSLAVCAPPAQVDPALKELVEYKLATVDRDTLTLHVSREVSLKVSLKVSHERGQVSHAEAARRLGVCRSTLYRYLNGGLQWPADLLAKWEGTSTHDSRATVSATPDATVCATPVAEASPGSSAPPTPVPSSLSHSLSIPTPVTPSPTQTPPQRAREEKQGNLDLEETTRGEAVRLAEVIQGCRVLGPVTLRPVEFALELLKPDAFPGINLFAAVLDCERWCQEADKPTKDGRRRISNWLKKERIEASQRNVLSFVSPTQNRLPLKRTDDRDDPNWTPPEHPAMARWRAEMAAKAKAEKAKAAS